MASGPDTNETIRIGRDGRILVVTIDRPEVRNAVDAPTAAQLEAAFAAFDGDPDLDVAVLTGAGGTFCAGADLKALAEPGAARVNRVDADMAAPGPMGPTRMLLDKPVIAAVEGHAVAGGLELALWCDLRVAARDAVFGVYCRRWGVPLVDGGTVRLPRLIGQSRALDMILTGRGVAGDEAHDWGLVNRLCRARRGARRGAWCWPGSCSPSRSCACAPTGARPTSRRGSRWRDAMAREVELGLEPIRAGETPAGAARFAAGAGRHGDGV